MTKDDLKTGMTVKTRNNMLYLVLTGDLNSYSLSSPVKCNICLINNDYYESGEAINDDLTNKNHSDWDIVEVYSNSVIALQDMLDPDDGDVSDRTLIWKRKEVDWSKVSKDTKVFVRDYDNYSWIPAYFCRYDANNCCPYRVYDNGQSSFTHGDSIPVGYRQIKLYKENNND